VPIVLKSGSLILLEPSGHVKACNGIAFYYETKRESYHLSRIEVPFKNVQNSSISKLLSQKQADFFQNLNLQSDYAILARSVI
jgi:hypothetical protein